MGAVGRKVADRTKMNSACSINNRFGRPIQPRRRLRSSFKGRSPKGSAGGSFTIILCYILVGSLTILASYLTYVAVGLSRAQTLTEAKHHDNGGPYNDVPSLRGIRDDDGETGPPRHAVRGKEPKGRQEPASDHGDLRGAQTTQKEKKPFKKAEPSKSGNVGDASSRRGVGSWAGNRPKPIRKGGWQGGEVSDGEDVMTWDANGPHADEGRSWLAAGDRGGRDSGVDVKIGEPNGLRTEAPMVGSEVALLVVCADRADYLRRTLDAVRAYYPDHADGPEFSIPVIISQDGDSVGTQSVINEFKGSMEGRSRVIHLKHPAVGGALNGYQKLSAHYGWALEKVFDMPRGGHNVEEAPGIDKVIILEEDLEIAPDFFEYFSAMAPWLDKDHSLMAVSAWNDNGQAKNVKDNSMVYRSDFFPGLGWMMPRRIWQELASKWPRGYWDDWLREPAQRKSRQFIRPEVCRTYHFGKRGTSNNQFAPYLDNILLNTDPVAFRKMDFAYLKPERYRVKFLAAVRAARRVSVDDVLAGGLLDKEVSVIYDDKSYGRIAKRLGVMDDVKALVPRTGYAGVVTIWHGDLKVYITPRDLISLHT